MNARKGTPSSGWLVVFLMFLVLLFSVGARQAYGVFMDPLLQEFGWSRAGLSLSASLMLLSYGFSQPVIGWLIDNYSPKYVIAAGSLVMGSAIIILFFGSELWFFHVFYGIFAGIGAGAVSASPISVIVSRRFTEKRGRAIGITTTGMSVGQLVVPPILIFSILHFGWRQSFILLGLPLILLVPLILIILRRQPDNTGQQPRKETFQEEFLTLFPGKSDIKTSRMKGVYGSNLFILLILGFFFDGFVVNQMSVHFAIHAVDTGFNEAQTALALIIMGSASGLGALTVGYLTDRFATEKILGLIFFTRGLGVVSMIMAMQVPSLLYVAALFLGYNWVTSLSAITTLSRQYFGEKTLGRVVGALTFGNRIGAASGAFLGGYLFDLFGSYLVPFGISAMSSALGVINSFLLRRNWEGQENSGGRA